MNHMLSRLFPVLLLGALIAGCSSAKQIAERNDARCTARGLQPDSKEFNACLSQLEAESAARMESNRRALMERPMDLPINRQ